MRFSEFASAATDIESKSGDATTTRGVSDLLQRAAESSDADLRTVSLFIQGRAFPVSDGRKLGIGTNAVYKLLADAATDSTLDSDAIDSLVVEKGSIRWAVEALSFAKQPGLSSFGASGVGNDSVTVLEVRETFEEVASMSGSGSGQRRHRAIMRLLNSMEYNEIVFLARILLGEMRIGVGEGTVRDGISDAFSHPESAVEHALQMLNDYGEVAVLAANADTETLREQEIQYHRPVQSMLAQTGDAEEAVERYETVAVQPKYDGARAQIHYDGDDVSVFTREMEDITASVPDVVGAVTDAVGSPAVIDAEIVAVDGDTGNPLDFQHVLRRIRRKEDVDRMQEEVPLEVYAFDLLKTGDETVTDTGFSDRYDLLSDVVNEDYVAPCTVCESVDEIVDQNAEALSAGHEGVMLKDPVSKFVPGDRGKSWLKLKPEVETLDLVVTGGEWGEGRRANQIGSVTVSARDEDAADLVFKDVGKVATGLTDEEVAELTDRVRPAVISEDGHEFRADPEVVLEVGYQDIQTSPEYDSGYALRFPRVESFRPDKPVSEADSVRRVTRIHESEFSD